jgi:putative ABC transport system permease protein
MIGGVFKSTFPNSPFSYYFLDEEFNKQYAADQRFHSVFRTLSAFAILIACLGLFGLISFSISRRGKEIGIRKVLGASIAQIIGLLSRDFMKLIVISIFIAMPITYFLVERWLRQYAYRIEISPRLFVLSAIIIFGLSLVTLLLKTYRFSKSHPAESMRDE